MNIDLVIKGIGLAFAVIVVLFLLVAVGASFCSMGHFMKQTPEQRRAFSDRIARDRAKWLREQRHGGLFF